MISGDPVREPLFDRDEILDALDAVGAELAARKAPATSLIVVGGSYLALQGLREATADVDTVTRIEASVRDAVEAVAARGGRQ